VFCLKYCMSEGVLSPLLSWPPLDTDADFYVIVKLLLLLLSSSSSSS
jgi:hypothetical protein